MSRDAEIQSEIVVKRWSSSKKRNRDGLKSNLTPAKKRLSAEKCRTTADRSITQVRIETEPEQVTLYLYFHSFINITSFRI